MNCFNLTFSGKQFIYPSILNDSLARQSNLGCRSLSFMTWNTSFQPLLVCKISFEKSKGSLMGTPLQVIVSFSLAAFEILFLSLILGNVMVMCLGVYLDGSLLVSVGSNRKDLKYSIPVFKNLFTSLKYFALIYLDSNQWKGMSFSQATYIYNFKNL